MLVLKDPSGNFVRAHLSLKLAKNLFHTVVILLVSNDQAGKIVIAQIKLKALKKLSHGDVAFSPNHSANDGIYVTFTHVIVVPACGTNGLLTFWNVHLSAQDNDNVIGYVPAVAYVCVISSVRFHVVPSHRSTVYAFAKYLLIFNV